MRGSRNPRSDASGPCAISYWFLLPLAACAGEETPDLGDVEYVFFEDQSWESGGGSTRLTIWANGDSEIRVYPGAPHLFAETELRARTGWEKVETPSGITFLSTSRMTREEGKTKLAAAVRAGISLIESENADYLDGGGVLLGAMVNGELHEATIPTYNERLRQRERFDSIAEVLGDLPGGEQAFEVRPRAVPFMYDEQAKQVLQSMNVDRNPVSVIFHPMALNRLEITLLSLNPDVPDLVIFLVDAGSGWELERPSREEISDWLDKSGR